jgi:DNA-binding transcriptional regulator YbjK
MVHLFMRSTSDPDIAAAVICTREVSVGMLFAQARQVMREYEAASSQPREQELTGSWNREQEAAGAEPREHEAVGADVLTPSRD